MEHHSDSGARDIFLFQDILSELGIKMSCESLILDFGCGQGETVYQFRKMGLKAFGADISTRFEPVQGQCKREGMIAEDENIFRSISFSPYTIPFEDDTFDFVFSNQVLEHVQDYSAALEEIRRILKPEGIGLHVFPSKWRPIECHTLVPLGGVLRGRVYLALCALLGIRNSYQKQANSSQVASRNFDYLKNCTMYLSKSEIRKYASSCFGNIEFVERQYLKHSAGRGRHVYQLAEALPLLTWLFSSFHMRAILFKKKQTGSAPELVA